MSWWRVSRPTVEPVIFLFMLSSFWQYSLFQDLVYKKVCTLNFNSSVCSDLYSSSYEYALHHTQTESSYWFLVNNAALTVPSVIFVLYLGVWSDRYGRKIPLFFAPLGGLMSSAVYIWMAADPSTPVELVILGGLLSGVCGGYVSSIMTCMSYISTVSDTSERTLRVSRVEAMTFLGGTIGPFISASVLSAIGTTYSFCILAADHLINIVYIFFLVPHATATQDHIAPPMNFCSKYFGLSHLWDGIRTAFKRREQGQRLTIILLLVCLVIIMTTTSGEMDISYLYVNDKPIEGSYETYSYFLGFKYGMAALVLLVGMPVVHRYLHFHDTTICCIGLVSRIAGLILLGLSRNKTMLFFVPVLSLFTYFSVPSVRSLLSKLVLPEEQGKIFSFVAIIEIISTFLASAIYNSAYPATRSFYNGLMFEVAAVVILIPLGIVSFLYRIRWNPYQSLEIDVEETSSSSESQNE